ncbi:hypothetical protein [Chroococcus sp. FPU101]|uniref:hypothetical protein n=1 Tax=Chroococcus sp. FPU101 TaxID=1974212 RepID=UPI001A8E13CC|nr:hypothetical protein [Chroococcus sp. FPU101]
MTIKRSLGASDRQFARFILQILEQQELLVRQEKDSGLRFVPIKLFQPKLPPFTVFIWLIFL